LAARLFVPRAVRPVGSAAGFFEDPVEERLERPTEVVADDAVAAVVMGVAMFCPAGSAKGIRLAESEAVGAGAAPCRT
jgi:hypothetical protein